MFVDVENFESAGHGDHMIWGTLLCRRLKKWQNKNCNYWKEALQRTNLWLKKQKTSSMLCAYGAKNNVHSFTVSPHACCNTLLLQLLFRSDLRNLYHLFGVKSRNWQGKPWCQSIPWPSLALISNRSRGSCLVVPVMLRSQDAAFDNAGCQV